MIRFVFVALIMGSSAASIPGQDSFEADWNREAGLIIKPLEELAEWARSEKLFGECIRTYQLLIVLDPDHSNARRILRYRRKGKDGPWERNRPFKVPKNLRIDSIDAFKTRRKLIVDPFVRAVIVSLDKHADDIDAKRREEVLRALIRMDPENKDARDAFGDVKSGDEWLPEDAVVAAIRRKELSELAKKIRDEAPQPATTSPRAEESALGIAFTHVLKTENLRVLSTADGSESRKVASWCQIAPRVFNKLLLADASHPQDYTIFLLPNADSKKKFLDKHPEMDADKRKYFGGLAGGWVNNSSHLMDWALNEPGRIDYAVRQTIGLCFMTEFGIRLRHGWVWEGFGLYLTDLICETKLTYYVRPSHYGSSRDSLREKLMKQKTNWFQEGLILLKSENAPQLGRVLSLDASAMNDEEMLYAYVLAAWLIETQSKKLGTILRDVAPLDAVGAPQTPGAEVLKKHLGIRADELELRVMRWLEAVAAKK